MDNSIRIGLQQRVLPTYRAPFIETLGELSGRQLSVFAGQPLASEAIATTQALVHARFFPATNQHFLNPGSPFYLCRQSGLIKWLQAEQPQILIVEANPRYLSTPEAVDWMHRQGRPVLGWGLGAPRLGGGVLNRLRRAERDHFLKRLDGVIAYSQRGAAEYAAAGFPPERVFVAHNAAVHRPAAPLANPGTFAEKPVVLFVGRLQARKRLEILFEACAALPAPLQPDLVIVGDGPARPEFEQAAQQIYPAARFAGARHGPDLDAYFAAADLFVLPGTGGLAVQQAMAAGLPVIVAQGDGTQDDLARPAAGWQIPPDNLQALSSTLHLALSDRARLQAMGRAAFQIVAEEINLETMALAFLKAIQQIQLAGLR